MAKDDKNQVVNNTVDNAGIYDDVIGYGNPVLTPMIFGLGSDTKMPALANPPATPQADAVEAVNDLPQAFDNKYDNDARNGWSRNYHLEQLRNQHPFVPIHPQPQFAKFYKLLAGIGAPNISIYLPQNTTMIRITPAVSPNSGCMIYYGFGAIDVAPRYDQLWPNGGGYNGQIVPQSGTGWIYAYNATLLVVGNADVSPSVFCVEAVQQV